jgi:hypothetical protein
MLQVRNGIWYKWKCYKHERWNNFFEQVLHGRSSPSQSFCNQFTNPEYYISRNAFTCTVQPDSCGGSCRSGGDGGSAASLARGGSRRMLYEVLVRWAWHIDDWRRRCRGTVGNAAHNNDVEANWPLFTQAVCGSAGNTKKLELDVMAGNMIKYIGD